jgi:hypothetical protein
MNNPSLPTVEAQFEWTPKMVSELKKCKENILHFAESYFYIINSDEGRQTIKLHSFQKKALRMIRDNRFSLLLFSRQVGKALSLDTKIPTPNGWTTMGELKTGDFIFDEFGNPCKIKYAHDVMHNRPCYKITFDTGEEVIADEEHLWYTQTLTDRKSKREGSVKTTKEIAIRFKTPYNSPYHRIPYAMHGINYEIKNLEIDPYILGIWLGDGYSAGGRIISGNRDVQELNNILSEKCEIKIYTKSDGNHTLTLKKLNGSENSLHTFLRKMNLLNNKHIPEEYMVSSREQRLELLRGLIDSDGYIDKKGQAFFYNKNINLVKQVNILVKSLGYKTTYKEKESSLYEKKCGTIAFIYFKPREEVCKLSFKRNRLKINEHNDSKCRNRWHYITNVEQIQTVPVRCITVDNSTGLFLFGDNYIPTHNSTISTIFLLWVAIFQDDQRILLVANKENTAKEIFKRVRFAYENLPNWLKAPVQYYGLESMELANGSRIGITTTTGTAGRGSSANLLFVDEADWIEPNMLNEFWASVYPIISSSNKSKIIMASTPRDTSGLFYKLYDQSVKGEGKWVHMRVIWNEVPGRDEKWAKDTKAGMADPSAWKREFECQFDEVGETAIDVELFDELRRYAMDPMYVYDDGKYLLWEKPNEEKLYVAGVDISEGVGKDATVIQIMDITEPRRIKQVATYHNNKISPSEFTPKLAEILQHWGNPLAMIERNGCGGQVVDNLKRDFNYDNIVNWGINRVANRKSNQHGIVAHTNTKYDAVLNQRYWINIMRSVQINDINTVIELKDFTKHKNGTWGAKHGSHDDRVMSLAWALMVLHEEIAPVYFDIIEKNENSKPVIIKSVDFGIKYFMNPESIYTNEKTGIGGDALPIFTGGNMTSENPELDDLYNQGWKPYIS